MGKAYEKTKRAPAFACATPQIHKYMRDLKRKYGFLSNYEETIFLRQEFIEGRWVVDYVLSCYLGVNVICQVGPGQFPGHPDCVRKAMLPGYWQT